MMARRSGRGGVPRVTTGDPMGIELGGDPTSRSVVRRMTVAEALAMRGTGWDGDLPALRAAWARAAQDDFPTRDLGSVIGSDTDTAATELDIDRQNDPPRDTDL